MITGSRRSGSMMLGGTLAALALLATACGEETDESAQAAADGDAATDDAADEEGDGSSELEELTAVLAWFPDPESGGFYAADEEGYYEEAGLEVDLEPGGPEVSSVQLVASGQADIGMSDATTVVNAREEGIPVVAIGAMYQTNPVGVMVHESLGIESFEDMADMTWVVQTGQAGPAYIREELGIDFETRAYQGSISEFLVDDSLVQQGWPTNEVYMAQQEGVETDFFSYAESGFNPYNDVMFVSEDFLAENGDLVSRFLDASMDGWVDYIGDVEAATTANERILEENGELSEETLWFGWDAQREYILDGEGSEQLGAMTGERWSTLVDQLLALGELEEELDPEELYDASYLPDTAPPEELPDAPEGAY